MSSIFKSSRKVMPYDEEKHNAKKEYDELEKKIKNFTYSAGLMDTKYFSKGHNTLNDEINDLIIKKTLLLNQYPEFKNKVGGKRKSRRGKKHPRRKTRRNNKR
jgi:hypothetical protein